MGVFVSNLYDLIVLHHLFVINIDYIPICIFYVPIILLFHNLNICTILNVTVCNLLSFIILLFCLHLNFVLIMWLLAFVVVLLMLVVFETFLVPFNNVTFKCIFFFFFFFYFIGLNCASLSFCN